jgi:hypothetical protein
VKRIPLEANTGEFFIGYFDALRVGVGIQLALSFQALFDKGAIFAPDRPAPELMHT